MNSTVWWLCWLCGNDEQEPLIWGDARKRLEGGYLSEYPRVKNTKREKERKEKRASDERARRSEYE